MHRGTQRRFERRRKIGLDGRRGRRREGRVTSERRSPSTSWAGWADGTVVKGGDATEEGGPVIGRGGSCKDGARGSEGGGSRRRDWGS